MFPSVKIDQNCRAICIAVRHSNGPERHVAEVTCPTGGFADQGGVTSQISSRKYWTMAVASILLLGAYHHHDVADQMSLRN